MVAIFPPTGASLRTRQPASEWREFAFALHQVQLAIEPNLSLKYALLNWNWIAGTLAENPRARSLQGPTSAIEPFFRRSVGKINSCYADRRL